MSRRQKRYLRRKEKREKAKEKFKNIDFENVASLESLYKASYSSAKGVKWKASVQKYLLNLLFNISKTRKNLLNQKDIRLGFIEFDINERGKIRHIKSVHFTERVVQKSLCTNVLYPVLTRNLIEDNGASQKGKGTHFATQRLIKSLIKYYNHYGNDGYVLTIDYKSYFDNINHEKLKEIYSLSFSDEKILKLANDFVDAFGDKGLGLGSETSQISAVSYVNSIDHFIKENLSIKAYGRYMDDSYIICHSKNVLQTILNVLKSKCEQFGIKINEKKTNIKKLQNGFTFLKTRFFLTDSGKILRKPCRDSITRERKRLKSQAGLFEKGILNSETINGSFQSWLGSMKYRTARKTVYFMKCLYNKLFMKGVEK
jgi:retron-type reverse transcriptase